MKAAAMRPLAEFEQEFGKPVEQVDTTSALSDAMDEIENMLDDLGVSNG